jgi:hypothetical protein
MVDSPSMSSSSLLLSSLLLLLTFLLTMLLAAPCWEPSADGQFQEGRRPKSMKMGSEKRFLISGHYTETLSLKEIVSWNFWCHLIYLMLFPLPEHVHWLFEFLRFRIKFFDFHVSALPVYGTQWVDLGN